MKREFVFVALPDQKKSLLLNSEVASVQGKHATACSHLTRSCQLFRSVLLFVFYSFLAVVGASFQCGPVEVVKEVVIFFTLKGNSALNVTEAVNPLVSPMLFCSELIAPKRDE